MVTVTEIFIISAIVFFVFCGGYYISRYIKSRELANFEKISYSTIDKKTGKEHYFSVNKHLQVTSNMSDEMIKQCKIMKMLRRYGIREEQLQYMDHMGKKEDDVFDAMNLSVLPLSEKTREINGTDLSNITPEKRFSFSGAYIGDLPPGATIALSIQEPRIMRRKETVAERRNRKMQNPIYYFNHNFKDRVIAALPYWSRYVLETKYQEAGYEGFRYMFAQHV